MLRSFVVRVLCNDYVPVLLCDKIIDWHESTFKRLGLVRVVDKDLILEDGAQCSAMHCCDPVDHEEKDHPK
jgi:hypothetical protein